ncbi:hypothetical protein M3I01_008920 [Marinomonas sp. RSW2]|uniref:Uncharacterized protein n=1 Tax=Marinomonas maritima TaxID=2940935 RepID=A0ABT5WG90_9GAMM|nr:hypothetical protein [Marinomonas maritima]MDE8603045.1 hypothetical protein [Marinomonas maritima]
MDSFNVMRLLDSIIPLDGLQIVSADFSTNSNSLLWSIHDNWGGMGESVR